MEEFYNKHYIRIDTEGCIIKGFSDAFEQPIDGDICINEQGSRHFEMMGIVNPPLTNIQGIYLYKYVEGEAMERTPEEIQAEILQSQTLTLKENKITEIKSNCESYIINGFDADVLGRGNLHYTLTLTKQDDLKVLYQSVKAGASSILWHDNSRVMHEVYTAEQFLNLYSIGYKFMISAKIRSDGLEQYLINLINNGDYTTARQLNWDTALPAEIQEVVDAQITLMLGGE